MNELLNPDNFFDSRTLEEFYGDDPRLRVSLLSVLELLNGLPAQKIIDSQSTDATIAEAHRSLLDEFPDQYIEALSNGYRAAILQLGASHQKVKRFLELCLRGQLADKY